MICVKTGSRIYRKRRTSFSLTLGKEGKERNVADYKLEWTIKPMRCGAAKRWYFVLTLGFINGKQHRPYNDSALFYALCFELVENRSSKLDAAQGKRLERSSGGSLSGERKVGMWEEATGQELLSLGADGWPGVSAALCQEIIGEGLPRSQSTDSREQLRFLLFKELNSWKLTHLLKMLPRIELKCQSGIPPSIEKSWGQVVRCRERRQRSSPACEPVLGWECSVWQPSVPLGNWPI